jgi:hypothetical protein
MEPSRPEWVVPCRDVANRRRHLTVSVSQGHVVVTTPPGETAVFEPLATGQLRAALRAALFAAAVEAETRAGRQPPP